MTIRNPSSARGLVRRHLGLFAVGLLLLSGPAFAQGDGPKSQQQFPTGLNFLVPIYLYVDGNYNFAGNILLPDADIRADIFALSYFRAFSLGGRYAQIYVTPIFGDVDGELTVPDPNTGALVTRSGGKSGFADPFVIFKLGLVGMDPLTIEEMMQRGDPGFQLGVSAGLTLPVGDYDRDDVLNLGIGVWSLRLGAPMTIPLTAKRAGRVSTHLELMPTVTFYEDNDDPNLGANEREQDPLFALEAHLLHDFNAKWWGSVDLRYVNGGETTTDGVADDNRQEALGGGATLSYAFTRFLSLQGTWGTTLEGGSENVDVDTFRLKLALIF